MSGLTASASLRARPSPAKPYTLQLDAKTNGTPRPRRREREADAGAVIDLVRRLLELLAHRVVRDRREVDDAVEAREKFLRELPHVAEMCTSSRVSGIAPGSVT